LEVVEFYSKLMGSWSELENYAKVSYCHVESVNAELEKRS